MSDIDEYLETMERYCKKIREVRVILFNLNQWTEANLSDLRNKKSDVESSNNIMKWSKKDNLRQIKKFRKRYNQMYDILAEVHSAEQLQAATQDPRFLSTTEDERYPSPKTRENNPFSDVGLQHSLSDNPPQQEKKPEEEEKGEQFKQPIPPRKNWQSQDNIFSGEQLSNIQREQPNRRRSQQSAMEIDEEGLGQCIIQRKIYTGSELGDKLVLEIKSIDSDDQEMASILEHDKNDLLGNKEEEKQEMQMQDHAQGGSHHLSSADISHNQQILEKKQLVKSSGKKEKLVTSQNLIQVNQLLENEKIFAQQAKENPSLLLPLITLRGNLEQQNYAQELLKNEITQDDLFKRRSDLNGKDIEKRFDPSANLYFLNQNTLIIQDENKKMHFMDVKGFAQDPSKGGQAMSLNATIDKPIICLEEVDLYCYCLTIDEIYRIKLVYPPPENQNHITCYKNQGEFLNRSMQLVTVTNRKYIFIWKENSHYDVFDLDSEVFSRSNITIQSFEYKKFQVFSSIQSMDPSQLILHQNMGFSLYRYKSLSTKNQSNYSIGLVKRSTCFANLPLTMVQDVKKDLFLIAGRQVGNELMLFDKMKRTTKHIQTLGLNKIKNFYFEHDIYKFNGFPYVFMITSMGLAVVNVNTRKYYLLLTNTKLKDIEIDYDSQTNELSLRTVEKEHDKIFRDYKFQDNLIHLLSQEESQGLSIKQELY